MKGDEDMADTKRNAKPLTSIVSYPERGEGGSNRYRGNCSPQTGGGLNWVLPSRDDMRLYVRQWDNKSSGGQNGY